VSRTKVAWREGGAGSTQVMLYDLTWLGTTRDADILGGPTPPTYDVDIGDRFVVWSEGRGDGGYHFSAVAYDLATATRVDVTTKTTAFERHASTSGPWIVWQAIDVSTTVSRILARNMDTGEERVIADNGASSHRPSVDGDLVAYESDLYGSLDVFVYRLSTGETFRITNGGSDHYLNDVFGSSIAYVDQRTGTEDIYVAHLDFAASPPCYPDLPAPQLRLTGRDDVTLPDGRAVSYYRLGIENWAAFPNEMFALTPLLPPCGANPNASRTWERIYDQAGSYLYEFCALSSAAALENTLWFSTPQGEPPPEYVYVTLQDRLCDTTYTSNLAWTNLAPVADAGPDQSVHTGTTAILDGSASVDRDGDYPLVYAWTLSARPAGSTASLSDPSSVSPSFTADMEGDYRIDLVVTDARGLASGVAQVEVGTTNTPPVAEAGPDQAIGVVGAVVSLSGATSYDVDGDPITFLWTFTTRPSGSTAAFSDATSVIPTFVADVHGDYVLSLVVSDAFGAASPADSVTVSFANVAPAAAAGSNQSVVVGHTVQLDGSGSSDANGDPLTYRWSLASVPTRSAATLASPTSVATRFVPDLPGTYVASLVVDDGFVSSEANNVTVVAVTAQSEIVGTLGSAISVVNTLGADAIRNPNLRNALTHKIGAALLDIDSGRYQEALDKLRHDILGKTDGCAGAGAPDRNDWITDCAGQSQVYPLILQAIAMLEELIEGS
jgi:hypothetical protein